MPEHCPECGASVQEGGTCRDNFDALLILEWRIPGGCGHEAHFLAVTTYILQHPDSMNHRADAYDRLRRNIADLLDGNATLEELLNRTRRAADGPTRTTRRPGDPASPQIFSRWLVTVADVLPTEPNAPAYAAAALNWARSVRETLDSAKTGV